MGNKTGREPLVESLNNPELDIERLAKLHKSIDVVVNLVKAVFHAGEPFLQVLYNRNNPGVVRLE